LQLRHDPKPSVAFGVRSRDTSQISASVCSYVSSPLRHEQTPSGRRVSGPTEEVERMPCFTRATAAAHRSCSSAHTLAKQGGPCAGRETPQRNGPRVSHCRSTGHAVSSS
jgi:hypothetical protein